LCSSPFVEKGIIGELLNSKNLFLHTKNNNSQNLQSFIKNCSSSPFVEKGVIGDLNIFI
jgi:hypothetical protein